MPKITTAGKHTGKVKSAEFGESQEKGTPYLYLGLENTAGEFIGAWLYLSEVAFNGALKTLRDAFRFDGNFETCIAQVTGKPCTFDVVVEQFEGKERFRVKWINGPSSAKPLSNETTFLKNLTAAAARIPADAPRAKAAAAPKAAQVKEPDPF